MKILHLGYDHIGNPWLGGGGAYQMHEILSRLTPRHTVEVLRGSWPGCDRVCVKDGVIYRFSGPAFGRISSRVTYSLWAMLAAAKSDYDLLIDGLSAVSPTFAGFLARRTKIADVRLNPYEAIEKHPIMEPVVARMLNANIHRYDACVTLGKSLAHGLKTHIGNSVPISVVPPGVDRSLFRENRVERNFLLFLGRLDVEHKGLDDLLRAFGRVKKKHKEIRLVIAGDGPNRDEVNELISQNGLSSSVEMTGWVRGKRKAGLLSQCLLVCMPSRREGWGQVATEASACGTPVVGYDVTGLRDAITDGETGILVDAGDVKALGDAIDRLIAQDTLRSRMGKNARTMARQYTWEKSAKAYEEVCLQALHAHSYSRRRK